MPRADRGQFLAKLTLVGTNRGIRDIKDFRNAAIVCLDLEDLSLGMLGGELQDIFEIRAPPRVNSLRVFPYDHDVSVAPGNRIYQLRLNAVGVLIFVHENVTELVLI